MRPERLRDLVAARNAPSRIVLDEVQKVPELLDVVHQLMEERPRHTFVLTGSSARKLKRSGVDLLAGRAALTTLHPFMAAELGDAFDLDTALDTGLVLDDVLCVPCHEFLRRLRPGEDLPLGEGFGKS